ncbi:MAG: hypothetical protein D6793_11085 [Thermoflexia bacterium]|nr:MAG: hypothetical protein D6793_11085 [Thermoflexia bacterium]
MGQEIPDLAARPQARDKGVAPFGPQRPLVDEFPPPRVYNYVRYLVGLQAVAEDLTATVFEKAWRCWDRYRAEGGALSTWLFAPAKNVARDYFRRRNREVPLEWARGWRTPTWWRKRLRRGRSGLVWRHCWPGCFPGR